MHTKRVTFLIVYEALYERFMNIQLLPVFQYELSPVQHSLVDEFVNLLGGGSRVVVSTAAFHARVRLFVSRSRRFEKKTKMFLPHPLVKLSIVGDLRDRQVACLASDLKGLNFESRVWRAVSSHSSHHPQEVLLAQFSLYVHRSGIKPDSFHLDIC